MVQPFPVRESSILGLAELVSRLLGLLFLARFVTTLGLAESAEFRMLLPLIGVAATLGTVGLPQALTRLFATSAREEGRPVPLPLLSAAAIGTGCAIGFALLLLFGLSSLASQQAIDRQELALLLGATVPLLLLICVTGSLRGALLGLGHTYSPALSQVLEVSVRLVALTYWLPMLTFEEVRSAELGILTLTLGEAASCLLLSIMLWRVLKRRGVRQQRSQRALFSILRMSFAPTGQALLASLGYALELPLAHRLLAQAHGEQLASVWLAEYATIALPLLCAPMVLTDGIATALLPVAAAERLQRQRGAFSIHLRRIIGAVMMVALPASGALIVLAPQLEAWFRAPGASLLLWLLAPIALPLYLQAPLSALLQAQGRSRALLYAGLLGDLVRLLAICLLLQPGQFERSGLALSFWLATLVQTGTLLWMLSRLSIVSVPWRTLYHSFQAALTLSALLLVGLHVPFPFSFAAHPFLWSAAAALSCLCTLLVAEEISPQSLARLPIIGSTARFLSEKLLLLSQKGSSSM
ncbi:oligosaccharide flippase family protein [Tumebacillus lipolyticus]|uniref:Oligosaccharide flippase family protein n=1 Tax=Tumebacillus lipolyticus TaxID=1280370 RepID=A0ABW5A1B4_9BACL